MSDDTRPTPEREHPITPPPSELIEQWLKEAPIQAKALYRHIATAAAQWGADQELEACVEWTTVWISAPEASQLRAARRPKTLTLGQRNDAELAANELSLGLRAILIEAKSVVGEVVQ